MFLFDVDVSGIELGLSFEENFESVLLLQCNLLRLAEISSHNGPSPAHKGSVWSRSVA